MNMSQKDYYKKEHTSEKRRPISYKTAVKRLISIMFSKPSSPISIPVPPYSPFCYLPPGHYVP